MKYIDRSRVGVPANLQGQAAPTPGERYKRAFMPMQMLRML